MGLLRYRAAMEQLSAEEIRCARALIGWTQSDLAGATRLGVRTIKRAEGGDRLTAAAAYGIRLAFESAGIVFVGSVDDLAGKDVIAGVVLVRKPE